MTEIDRWTTASANCLGYAPEDGELVKYEDHLAQIKALEEDRQMRIDHEETLHKVRAQAEDRAEVAETRVRDLEALLRSDQPWCLAAVLEELAAAADILLDRKSYDGHGHERIAVVRRIARESALEIRRAMLQVAPPADRKSYASSTTSEDAQ